MTPSTVSYYTDTVARGVEDYYAGRGEAAGLWLGNGSAAAGLAGEVSGEQLALLFEGRHPLTDEPLGAAYGVRAGADRVTGWDLTFSAPKSVSTLWAVGGGTVGFEVRDAHDAAVRAALGYLEEHAAFSRQGKAGVRQVDTDGLVAAGFVHRTSRAGDPQLHTHVLVSGRVRCADGVWRALDSRALHRQLKPAGMLYQAALRAELTARLGVAWGSVDRHGQAEIDGVPETLRRRFSTRRAEVEVRARERIAAVEVTLGRALTPEERRRQFELGVLETRTAKTVGDGTDDGLHDRWHAEAAELGLPGEGWTSHVLDRAAVDRPVVVETVVAEVLEELRTSRSTWARRDVVQGLTRRAPTGLAAEEVVGWVETAVERVLAHPAVVALTAPRLAVPAGLRRRDGQSVFEPHGAARFTTDTTLALEQQVLDTVLAGRDAGRSVAQPAAVENAIGSGGLGEDQAAAVTRITTAGEAVACLVGPAGAGKSRAMGAAASAWTVSGIPVRGLALSAVAAGVLETEAGIPSTTIAKFLHEYDHPDGPEPGWTLERGEVVVVDEAGMVASQDLARLVTITSRAEAKLVLVGDHAQLGAIEAGGLFRLLANDTHAAELHEIRRFVNPWEADASLRLRDRHDAALDSYEQHHRIVGGDRLAMLDEAFARWQTARHAGESVVVVAADHDTADALALRARASRIAAGEVEPDGIPVGNQTVGAGDEIVTLRNDRRLVTGRDGWVRNGDRWHIDTRHDNGSLTVESLTGRGRIVLPADYVAEHVQLGYALTIHKAQGVTVDHAVVLADERLGAEALYVAMTRGRHDNTALVITDHLSADDHDREYTPTPRQVLDGILARPTAERAALDHLRQAFHHAESLAVLAPRLANLDAWITEHEPPDRSDQLTRAETRLRRSVERMKPGRLTRGGRDNRRHLDQLTSQRDNLAEAQNERQHWLTKNADTLDYRRQLADQVTRRRQHLGIQAAEHQPAHVIDLLGPYPDNPDHAERWAARAARIESYREEWNVEPDQLRTPPADRTQARSWQTDIGTVIDNQRLHTRLAARHLELGRSRGNGIER